MSVKQFAIFSVPQSYNIGDDIQTLAFLQLIRRCVDKKKNVNFRYDLTRLNCKTKFSESVLNHSFTFKNYISDVTTDCELQPFLINRDRMQSYAVENVEFLKPLKTCLYGWYCHPHPNTENFDFPPPKDVFNCTYFSFFPNSHLKTKINQNCFSTPAKRSIATRDRETSRFLNAIGVEASWIGCITLTLQSNNTLERTDEIIVVDSCLPEDLKHEKNVTYLSHNIDGIIDQEDFGARLNRAQMLLDRYARAKLVITSRLHCALPCVALGTPVRFQNESGIAYSDHLKAEFGSNDRFPGLIEVILASGHSDCKSTVEKLCQNVENCFGDIVFNGIVDFAPTNSFDYYVTIANDCYNSLRKNPLIASSFINE